MPNTTEVLHKDMLIAQIKLGLHLQGIEFSRKPTRRMSIEHLEEQLDWLRRRYQFKQTQKKAA